ncbi:mucin-17-like [Sinocyclocheilus grahami]|uniref:mucin-17-like n=1 Tax=Sinocyclocheilus grahami TaxID=75366 RepID=UPI0007ACEABA|nr:PREDICTED: mucin-17-like [Sinocyclocheilus grahami]
MERWVLEGDSYSFLRSAPHTFNLQSHEGPNRVEIFDITSIPSHHNAISETTSLCDIFGGDGESPSLSSSPASATFIRREVDQSFPVDDANDSLGSYHTANGSDLSNNSEVTYNTPSPENTPDFSTSETRGSRSPPTKSPILSDSKNGLNQLDCTPPASKVNSNDLSHTDNWEESQVSVITAPVNEMAITNASEPQYVNSTPATTLIDPAKKPFNPTSCSSEEKEPAVFEQEGIIKTPQHISTSPVLDKQIFESNCESLAVSPLEQNVVMSSEDKESMIYCSPREQNILSVQGTMNSGSASELSNPSTTDCSLMQEMSTSPSNRDINFLPISSVMPEPRLTSTSPVIRETTSTRRSSPELLNLCPTQVRNTSETPDLEDTYGAILSVSTLHTSDNVEINSLTVSDISTETRGLVYSSTDGREKLESPEFNETCSSPDHSAPTHSQEPVLIHSPVGYTISPSPTYEKICSSVEPVDSPSSPVSPEINETCSSPHHSASAHSPEQVMIHSPVGYTISPSPTNERIVSSTEPEDSPSFPVVTRIEYRDICSSPDHSEPVIIHSSPCYNISPSPTNERRVYSTEPDASTSSPCGHSDMHSSSDHSIPAHSPEPEIIHSPMGYTISPSPTNKRMFFSVQPNDLPSSPAITGTDYTATPTCSRDSTPAFRSITSTPNSRENDLTPEPNSPATSLELRSVTCSPEIKTISYSVLPQNTKSPGITYNVIPTEDLAQSPAVEKNVCGNSSETSSYLFGNDTSVLPSSRNFLSTPESRSRPSSATSDHTKYTTLSSDLEPEPSITIGNAENQSLYIICDEVSHPFSNPIDRFDDHADTKTLKSLAFVPDECKGSGPPVQILQDSTSNTSDSGSSTIKIEKSQEIVTDNTTDLTFCGTPTSPCPWDASLPKPVASVEKKQCLVEVFDRNKGTEMLKNYSPSSDKRLSQVPVALRESAGVISRDNGGEFDRQPCREKEESGKKEGEGEETMGESSYRGEQVELSFSARNRKGPAGHSPALSSRDPKSGIPARCYFESHPTTLQQQSQLRAQGSQQENKGGARRLQSAAQGKYSSAGFLLPECTGETSSMGSEFDEADNEVKWFTDLAFRSLSSPQVDYLDVYNSSHRSSTNVSQPSTVDSPGAIAWMTYADLRGSALHENDGSSFLPRDSLDPNKRFEMGSFECVDIALESKEESSRGKRTVPKRQIQLLRRNTDESKHKGNNENIFNSPSTYRRSKDALVRQHSTPAFVQQEVFKEVPDSPQNGRKKTLQKSVSLDDGSPKTQMASCIIKSVLSKKMQDVQKETPKSTDPSPSGDKKHPDVSSSSFDGVPSTMEKHSLSSSQHSECTLSSEDFAVGEERISHCQPKKCAPKVPPKPFLRPAFFNNGEAQVAGKIAREETKPIVAPPQVDDKIQNSKSDRKEGGGSNLEEKYKSDSANASISNTSPVVVTPAISMQNRMTTRDIRKRQMTPENQEQLAGKSVFMSKTPEITLKPSIKGKKTTSLKVSLSPDLEQSREISESQSMEKAAEDLSTKSTKGLETEDDDDSNKKSVTHRVRDVRKLVKNTYNLSFKASNSTSSAEETVIQGKREKPPQTPPALHIECKAISWKDKQTSGSKAIHCHDEKLPVDISKISQPWVCAETKRDADITEIISKGSSPKTESKQKAPYSHSTITDGLCESESINKISYIHCDQSSKMPPRPPSKEREVSALVVVPDCTSKTKTVSPTILDSTQMTAASSSHSVSMLLKEKGMQADIGVCDVLTEGASATAKHVNRLEVPVQACLSESISSEVQVKAENTSLPCNPTAFVNNLSRTSQPSESPKGTLTEEPSTKEQEKKKTATTTMTQIPTYLATSGKPEVRSFSGSTKNNATPVNASKEIELPIQVRSISTDRLKPFVPPKPSYKQSFAEIKSVSSDPSKADTQALSVIKHPTILSSESKKNETPSTVTHKDQPNETSSRDTKRLAVSAVSSSKPPSIPVTTTPSVVQKSTTKTLASLDQQQSSAFLQSTSTCQQQIPSFSQDQSMLDSSFASNSSGPQALNHTPSVTRASSNNRFHTDDYLFYALDDPPSYDERESFSPLRLSDLPPHRSCRYHPTTKQSSCSCTPSSHSHQGHPNNSPQQWVPAASRSPGQVLTCPAAPPQAQVRPHQCRPDGLPVSNTTIPHASALIQPLHNPQACPVSNSQSYGDDYPPASGLHADRYSASHPSPQAAGPAPYHEYSHSANMSTLDPRPQLFNPQDLPPSFGHDYANEGPGGAGVLYPENASGLSCGQGPRRVLLDPETGKYFYIEVPMQPLRKMLFDPELGQYVEVLIPHQAMSHSGLYPPAAPPYSSLHSPGLYAPQSWHLPYAVPSYPAISGTAPQVRHPEPPPVPTTLHQTSLRYGSPASQMPKNEPKGLSSLDQSYLESMYYIPTGLNASPNATPSECYHKPSSMPPSGGRRA